MLEFVPIPSLQLFMNGKRDGTFRLANGSQACAHLPRERSEPYASRWMFNELIYCEIAEVLRAPAHPAGVFRAGDVTGLFRLPFGERLLGRGFPAKFAPLDPNPFSSAGYNVDKYYDAVTPDLFTTVIPAMTQLLLIDQLLWMLDRTPDNMLGVQSTDGRYVEVRSIDHEHCLALDGDPKHRWSSVPHDLSRCHPTQMTHFVDLSSAGKQDLHHSARELKGRLSVAKARDIAERVCEFLTERVGVDSQTELSEHVKRTLDLFTRLWESFEHRVQDFVDNYAPLLKQHGKTP